MTDKPNLHSIPSKHDELRAVVDSMRRNLPIFIETASINAQVRRAHYDAYVKQGFTKEEALVLCQKVTL